MHYALFFLLPVLVWALNVILQYLVCVEMQCHHHSFLVSVWRFCKVPDGKIRMINGRRLYSFDSRHSSLRVWDIAGCMFSKPADFLQTQTVITNCTMTGRNPDTSRHIIQGVSKKRVTYRGEEGFSGLHTPVYTLYTPFITWLLDTLK